ncbi:phage tail protein I [Vibrio parahaemolyticus]|nr:phage tail protein I [Vibrio parahaemolyticus]EHV5554799.1 phage tail protein I [Vibrio parahaemolyticus]
MLPKIFLKDIRLMALSQIAKDEMVGLRNAIYQLQLHDIDTVHESFLPFLAWIYRADGWSNDWPLERKRSVVKNALLLFKYKGTVWAVERALELSMFDATVVPWYAMLPEGTRGTFRIDAAPSDSRSLVQSDYDTLIALTESNKQGSQHWKGNIIHDPSMGSAYAAPVVRTRKRWTSNSIVPLHVTGMVIDPTDVVVYEGEPVSVSATVQMSDGTTTHDVRFESSDTSIVTVDGAGLVSYVSEGSASIYAISTFSDTARAECQIIAHAAPTLITITNVPELIVPDDGGSLIATVTYSNGFEVSSSDDESVVNWQSSDESILTVESNGDYVARAVGSAIVTATSTEVDAISGSAEVLVSKNFEQFSIVVQKKDVVGHPNIGVDYAQSYGEFSDDEWPNATETKLALRARYDGGGMYLTYFVSTNQYLSWRGWDGITITATHGSTSVSESLTKSTTGYSVRPEGNSLMYDFFDARVGETVDITLTEYIPTEEEKAIARINSRLGINF